MNNKELSKLEEDALAQEARMLSNLPHDQYNSLRNPYQSQDYNRELNESDTDWLPTENETILSYHARLTIYAKINLKHNVQSHIDGPKGAWWTHRNPGGCFMCDDTNLIHVMLNVIGNLAKKYPKGKL